MVTLEFVLSPGTREVLIGTFVQWEQVKSNNVYLLLGLCMLYFVDGCVAWE